MLAMQMIGRDGFLVSASCSHHLPLAGFQGLLQRAARHAGRGLQILETGRQGADHPVHAAMPETEYLKALFCRLIRD